MNLRLNPVKKVSGQIKIPGDKSISHRALIFGALANGTSQVSGLLESGDVHSTEACLRSLGVHFERTGKKVIVHGKGLHGLQAPAQILDCGNSGTTTRTLMGLLAGQKFDSTLTGDASIQKRPMKRAAEPLRKMGARIDLTRDEFAPLTIHGTRLKGIEYELKIASAQVKTALLLAGLYADGETTLKGKIGSRDHTERMLPYYGVKLQTSPEYIKITRHETLLPKDIRVPGDPSSAAFWIAAAALVPHSVLEIQGVSLNPTRTGFIEVMKRMGLQIEIEETERDPEPIGNLLVRSSSLRGTRVTKDEIPTLIDEIPLLSVVASQAEGQTIVHGAEELRVKESDRLEALAINLRAMGVQIETFEDGFSVEGPQSLEGAKIQTFEDHRIAMSFSIASLIAQGETVIDLPECVGISYPNFYDTLNAVAHAK